MDEAQFKQALLDETQLLAKIFKRKQKDVQAALNSMQGNRSEMIGQFLSALNLPLNQDSVVVINSVAAAEEKPASKKRGLFGWLRRKQD